MGPIKKFHYTLHATQRSRERALSFELLRNVVLYNETRQMQYRGVHGGVVWRFTKTVQGRNVIVVAEIKKAECWIISGYEEA